MASRNCAVRPLDYCEKDELRDAERGLLPKKKRDEDKKEKGESKSFFRKIFSGEETLESSNLGASSSSLSVPVCRICHSGERKKEMVSPCSCTGTLAYVHETCLDKWMMVRQSPICELCNDYLYTETICSRTVACLAPGYHVRRKRPLKQDIAMYLLLLLLLMFGMLIMVNPPTIFWRFVLAVSLYLSLWAVLCVLCFDVFHNASVNYEERMAMNLMENGESLNNPQDNLLEVEAPQPVSTPSSNAASTSFVDETRPLNNIQEDGKPSMILEEISDKRTTDNKRN